MTSLRKLERDFVRADLAAVTGILAQLDDEDVMARLGLEARRDELKQTIAHLDEAGDEPVASAALFFGGGPVIGARGIESEFAGSAVTKFQDIVAKVLAHESGGLGQRRIVPNKSASTLHITNIVHGSFGFLLEEVHPQQPLGDIALRVPNVLPCAAPGKFVPAAFGASGISCTNCVPKSSSRHMNRRRLFIRCLHRCRKI